MCVPGCTEHVLRTLSREQTKAALSRRGAIAALVGGGAAGAAALSPEPAAAARAFPAFRKAVDLTHTHSPAFPTFFGTPGLGFKQTKEFKKDGFNLTEWTVLEHSGTHIDTPLHFSEAGIGPEAIPVDQLVVPLAVINVADKAEANADYQLTPADIRAWEKRYGRLPRGCCVAMHAGWDRHVTAPRFVGKDAGSVFHFPGFHPEATDLLLKERQVVGIAVDTLSLDHGPSKDFKTHYAWLPSGRWGLECVANLAALPATGATLVVGAPKFKGATGGPTRLLALV